MKHEKVVWAAWYGDCQWELRDDNASGVIIDPDIQRYSLFRREGESYGRVRVFACSRSKWTRL